ncbi:MAG: hypothetical protein Q9214_002686 [Letrouitia sp. 1 TL-2023]
MEEGSAALREPPRAILPASFTFLGASLSIGGSPSCRKNSTGFGPSVGILKTRFSGMSDPLSIAAGVVGILTAATQISAVLIKFIRANKEAPQQARNIITELNETNVILSSLQAFLLGSKCANESMTSLIKVEDVVTVVSGCVLTFSELEKLVDDLKVKDPDVLDRMKWARKETTITGIIQRLQNHKASLSLILNVINGFVILELRRLASRYQD